MKKHLLLLFLTLLPIVASAEAVEIDGIYYNFITKIKEAEVTRNPQKYSGAINIPASVKYNDVEYSVTSIGKNAFEKCTKLTTITIPNSVTTIGSYAFMECTSLTEVTIPNKVTTIESFLFYNCSRLKSVTLPNGVTTIGEYAFGYCTDLTAIAIPNSVISIGSGAFYRCSNLTSIYISDLEAWCKVENYGNFYPALHLYLNGEEIKDLVIPNTVTSIGACAFSGFSCITSVNIPNSVTNIGYGAFSTCSGITSVNIPNSVTSIGKDAFADCKGLKTVNIPNSVTSIGEGAFGGCSGLNTVNLPNNMSNIVNYLFAQCTGITSITIPNSVTSIGEGGFTDCSSLTSINLPNSVTSIGSSAFYGCSNLSSVIIGSGICNIGAYAFARCPELTDVYCHSVSVPGTNFSAFMESYIEYATLHVPAESVNAYKAKEPWRNFKNIVSLNDDETDVANIPAKALLIQSEGGIITVNGAADGERVGIYEADGRRSGTIISRNGTATIATTIQSGSIAIVKVGEKSVKVVMK